MTNHTRCGCAGWSLGGYVFLNDQTGEDAAFEVAVVEPPAEEGGAGLPIESFTSGWCSRVEAPGLIEWCRSGDLDPGHPESVAWTIDPPDVETPEPRGRCHVHA
jgi:hypothetical protein